MAEAFFRGRALSLTVLFFCLTVRLAAGPLDHWVCRNPQPFCPQLQSLAHGNGLWVVLGNVGVLATSVDGVGWDLASLGTNAVSISVGYGNGPFVAGTSRGAFYSYDAH